MIIIILFIIKIVILIKAYLKYDEKYHYFGKYPDENDKNSEKFKINICKRKKCKKKSLIDILS
jgi:hypothetical protein